MAKAQQITMNGLRMLWRGFTLLWIITLGSVAMAAPLSADGTIEIDQPWARIAPNEDGTISVFFEVVSRGEKDDSLISATSRHAKTAAVELKRGAPTHRVHVAEQLHAGCRDQFHLRRRAIPFHE